MRLAALSAATLVPARSASAAIPAAKKTKEDKSAAIVAAAAKGAMVDARFFNRLFFEKAAKKFPRHGTPLSKRTRVKFECEKDGKVFLFTAFVGKEQIGAVCRSVGDIGKLIGGGPDPTIKK